MNRKDWLARQAYLDNELSVEQALALEARLTAAEREGLVGESRFEAALAARLGAGGGCPEEVWVRVRTRLAAAPGAEPHWSSWHDWRILALAALVIVNFGLLGALLFFPRSAFPKLHLALQEDLAAFADQNCERRCSFAEATAQLARQGFVLDLEAVPKNELQAITFLGFRMHELAGHQVAQLNFACRQQPVAVYIAEKSIFSINNLPLSRQPGALRVERREVGNYRVIAVSRHALSEVLDLFS